MNIFKELLGLSGREEDGSNTTPGTRSLETAVCALFLEMAETDGEFSDEEKDTIMALMQEEFNLSAAEAKQIADAARQELTQSTDLYQFTSVINEHFSKEDKIRIIELLWRIVYSDQKLAGHEDYLIHRLATLLSLSSRELIDAKLKIKNS